MNTNLLRQKISELTKKYSNKKLSVDEDLSFSDDYSAGESGTVKYRSKPQNATDSDGENSIRLAPSTNINEFESPKSPITANQKSISPISKDVIDTPKSEDPSLNSPTGITQRSKSISDHDNYSDLLSDKELDNPHNFEEDSIAEDSDDSSDYHPLKNIHLVSDDFLEDILTASEASANSDNVEERLTNRSTPRSVRSIPLSPFISPPAINKKSEVKTREVTSENDSVIEEQLKSDSEGSENYDSNFEEEKESDGSVSETLKKSKSTTERSSLSNRTGKTSHESSTSATIVKSPSESSVSNKKSERSIKSESVNEVSKSASSRTIKSDRKIDLSRGVSSENFEEEIQLDSTNTTKSEKYGEIILEIGDTVTRDQQEKIIEPVADDLSKSRKNLEIVVDKKKIIEFSKSSSQIDGFSKVENVNKYVQCNLLSDRHQKRKQKSRPLIHNLSSSGRNENVFYLDQPRRKPLRIDTRVENLPRRPQIKTNIKLFGANRLDSNLDFNIDSDNGIEGYDLNPTPIIAMDQILRNQIHLTKYFMDSHHKMYMACCQIVKSMNEDYQNNGLIYDNT